MEKVKYQVMPPLSPDEYQELYEDIRANGVLVPVIEDEDGVIIDGHHRSKIASELGIPCPVELVDGKSEAEKRGMAFTLNLKRRHLNREQRRALIAESLKADPIIRDREHARRVGVSPNTVKSVREAEGIPTPEAIIAEEIESSGDNDYRIGQRLGVSQNTVKKVRDDFQNAQNEQFENDEPDLPTATALSQSDLDELNALNKPAVPAETQHSPEKVVETDEDLLVKIGIQLRKAEKAIREARMLAYQLDSWTGIPLSDDARRELDALDEALKSGGFNAELERLIQEENNDR